MLVAAQNRQSVLPRQGRDPDVIRRDRSADTLQFIADFGIVICGSFVDDKYATPSEERDEPSFMARPIPRLAQSILVFAKNDHRNRDLVCLLENGFNAGAPSAKSDTQFVSRITPDPQARRARTRPR